MGTRTSTKTGIEEMLGKLFGSQDMIDTMQRIERVQSSVPVDVNVLSAPLPSQTQPGSQAIEQSSSHSDGCSDGCSDGQAVVQTVVQPVRRSVRRLFRRSDGQTVVQPVSQTVVQTVVQNDLNIMQFNDPVRGLTKNHARVLLYLLQQPGITQRQLICEQTGIPFGTVKDALCTLYQKGFINKPQYFVQGDFRGIAYVINRALCDDFVKKRGVEFQTVVQTVSQTVVRPVSQTVVQTVVQSDGCSPPFSSSLKTLKTTTTKDFSVGQPSEQPSEIVLTGPTGLFWEGEGLQESQAKKWCQQFEVEPQQMRQQLEWARFDLVGNGKSGEVRKDAISWFFGCLRQTGGCYPRPANYKSPAEIRAEQAEQAAREAREARERLQQAEQELAFDKLLSAPDSEAYQAMLDRASDFAKEMGGATLERELRTLYFE